MTSAFEALTGARIARIDSPIQDLIALTLSGREHGGTLLVQLRGARLGVGLVSVRPKGDLATPSITRLRHHIRGAKITGVRLREPGTLVVEALRGETKLEIEALFSRHHGNLTIRNVDTGRALTRLHQVTGQGAKGTPIPWPESHAELEKGGQRLNPSDGTSDSASGGSPNSDNHQAAQLRQSITSRIRSLTRRKNAIARDSIRADNVDQLRSDANLLLSQLNTVEREGTKIGIIDYCASPPQLKWLEIEAKLNPQQQAQKWFEQARRFERGAKIALERTALTDRELSRLRALLSDLDQSVSADFEHITDTARSLGAKHLGGTGPHATERRRQQRLPYHEFRSCDGRPLLVGRGPKDNDELTLHKAKPNDVFLHVRGCPGAHVIVVLNKREACPPATLLEAAELAAHFSTDKGASRHEISYTEKRYVRKAKGAPPGSVTLNREKVLQLSSEPSRLKRLLDSKRAH